MSSADRLTYTSSAEKGIPGVSGGLSGSKGVRVVLAGLGLFGLGAKYDQPAPVELPREGMERAVESFDDRERREAVNFGSEMELERPDELQRLLKQINERLRELHQSDFSTSVVSDLSESVSPSSVLPRSTAELTSEQVGQVFSGGQVTVVIDRNAGGGTDNFDKATGRVMEEAVGSSFDPALRWRTTVALLDDNGLTPEKVKLVHHGDQFQLEVGGQTIGVLQEADLALGEAALSKLGSDSQPDGVGDPKVDQPETVKVEENSPPADDPPKENTPPVSGGTGGGTPGSGPGTSGGSSGGAGSGKEAAPAASPSDTGPAKEKVPDPEPAKERVPAPEPPKEKVPSPEAPPEKPPVVNPPEKPSEEEERPGRPAQPVVPPAAPPVILPLVPPITGLVGADTILFDGGAQGESKVSPEKRVVNLAIKRGDSLITSGKVSEAPVREADVFLRGQWSRVRTAAVSTNGDFGQLDAGKFAIHSRVDRFQGGRQGPGVIERAVALKGVQAGDQVELTRSNGDVRTLTVVSKSFDDPQNVGKGEGQVVISTCDPDNMPQNLNDTMRLVIVAQETAVDGSNDNTAPIESGLPLAAVGAMLAARREEEKRTNRARRGWRHWFSLKRLFTQEDEGNIFSALGEVKQEDEA